MTQDSQKVLSVGIEYVLEKQHESEKRAIRAREKVTEYDWSNRTNRIIAWMEQGRRF